MHGGRESLTEPMQPAGSTRVITVTCESGPRPAGTAWRCSAPWPAPLALAAVLVPFRGSFPNTDAALALLLVVVAVAANGYRPARMAHDGSVTVAHRAWDVDTEGLPPGTDTELLVESGGVFQGRFLMTPSPGARPTLEQRLLAVALADQVGAALATSHPVGQG